MNARNVMQKLIILVAISGCFVSMVLAHESSAPTYFQADIHLSKDGNSIGNPTLIVEKGQRAEVVIGNNNSGMRLDFTLDEVSVTREGKPTASFHAQIFEQVDGNWILRAEPSAEVFLGTEASVSLPFDDAREPSPEGTLRITITAVAEDAFDAGLGAATPVDWEDTQSTAFLGKTTEDLQARVAAETAITEA